MGVARLAQRSRAAPCFQRQFCTTGRCRAAWRGGRCRAAGPQHVRRSRLARGSAAGTIPGSTGRVVAGSITMARRTANLSPMPGSRSPTTCATPTPTPMTFPGTGRIASAERRAVRPALCAELSDGVRDGARPRRRRAHRQHHALLLSDARFVYRIPAAAA